MAVFLKVLVGSVSCGYNPLETVNKVCLPVVSCIQQYSGLPWEIFAVLVDSIQNLTDATSHEISILRVFYSLIYRILSSKETLMNYDLTSCCIIMGNACDLLCSFLFGTSSQVL